jgi:lincosamide nucleotidyltransferase A/C/D/E
MQDMQAADVVHFYQQCAGSGIAVWVDGGWAVDALLGQQTRDHADLDIAVQQCDLAWLRGMLEAAGYRDVQRDDTRPWNFVLGDAAGRLIDIHVIELDDAGNGIYGPAENGEMYPAGSLNGTGSIAGQTVRCIAAEHLVAFHTGYSPRPQDIHDVTALCDRFGIERPAEYRGETPARCSEFRP